MCHDVSGQIVMPDQCMYVWKTQGNMQTPHLKARVSEEVQTQNLFAVKWQCYQLEHRAAHK